MHMFIAGPTTLVEPTRSAPASTFRVWRGGDPADVSLWLAAWEAWPEREVFYHPAYLNLYAADRAEPCCTYLEYRGARVLYAFYLRDLRGEPCWSPEVGPATDLVSPYGYGGPALWGAADHGTVAAEFEAHFRAWAAGRNVVSEFVRFSLFRKTLLPYNVERTYCLGNVVCDLEGGEVAVWDRFKPKVRKNVHSAQRQGVMVEVDETGARLDDFLRIYEHTMRRTAADETYYHGRTYFEAIARSLPGQFVYFHALHGGMVVASELVLLSAENAYSFLGGTDREHFALRPNELLKWEALRWLCARGYRRFVLGGGHEDQDGVFQYKLAFAPEGVLPFEVGRRVLDARVYRLLRERRAALAGMAAPRPNYFPEYRG